MILTRFFLTAMCVIALVSSIHAQDGQQVILKYSMDKSSWKLDNYQKVGTFVTYPEIEYLRSWGGGSGGGNFDLNFGGIFSGSINGFVTANDDSLQITNITVFDCAFEHFLFGTDQEVHSIGWAWNIGVTGHYLAQDMEEGQLETPSGNQLVAHIAGLNVGIGASYMLNLEDRLVVDSRLLYHASYNSSTTQVNEKTFHATGLRLFTRARYYLTHSWVGLANLQIDRFSHDPAEISMGDPAGKFSFIRFGVGIGYQW